MPRIAKNYANVEGNEIIQPKDKKQVRYSIFFLTWNLNKFVTDTASPDFQQLESCAETYFNSLIDNITDYIIIKVLGDTIDKVKAINYEPAFEIGGAQRRFHAHILIHVDHYTKVHLDINKIRTETNKKIVGGGYCNVIPSADTTRSIQDYIQKYNSGNFPEPSQK